MGHIHAAAMAEYAKDAAETDKPWERWEVTTHRGEWVALWCHPYWKEESEYRRKPRALTYTITIPEPLREAPGVGEVYYVAAPDAECFCIEHVWAGRGTEVRLFKRGLYFAKRDDAIAAAKAMLPLKTK